MRKKAFSSFNALAIMILAVCSLAPHTTLATEAPRTDEWRFSGGLYAWGSSIATTLSNGAESTLDLEDIVQNLDSVFFGNLEVGYGKYFVATDVIYLKLSGSDTIMARPSIGDIALDGSVDIESKINTTIAG